MLVSAKIANLRYHAVELFVPKEDEPEIMSSRLPSHNAIDMDKVLWTVWSQRLNTTSAPTWLVAKGLHGRLQSLHVASYSLVYPEVPVLKHLKHIGDSPCSFLAPKENGSEFL